jgi:hypothetical protein
MHTTNVYSPKNKKDWNNIECKKTFRL